MWCYLNLGDRPSPRDGSWTKKFWSSKKTSSLFFFCLKKSGFEAEISAMHMHRLEGEIKNKKMRPTTVDWAGRRSRGYIILSHSDKGFRHDSQFTKGSGAKIKQPKKTNFRNSHSLFPKISFENTKRSAL